MALTYSKKEDDFAKISTLKFNIVEDTVKPKRFLPAEWFPQSGVQLTWPNKDTDWNYILDDVVDCYKKIAFNIASREQPTSRVYARSLAQLFLRTFLQTSLLPKCL